MSRIFATDLPGRASIARMATVRMTFGDTVHYLVDLGDGLPQMAFWSGNRSFLRGERVMVYWANEAGAWFIRGRARATPSAGQEPGGGAAVGAPAAATLIASSPLMGTTSGSGTTSTAAQQQPQQVTIYQ